MDFEDSRRPTLEKGLLYQAHNPHYLFVIKVGRMEIENNLRPCNSLAMLLLLNAMLVIKHS